LPICACKEVKTKEEENNKMSDFAQQPSVIMSTKDIKHSFLQDYSTTIPSKKFFSKI